MFNHNPLKCYSLVIKIDENDKNNKILEQCNFVKKEGCDYCGRHLLNKTNKRIRIDDYENILSKKLCNPSLISFDNFLDNKTLDNTRDIDLYYTLKTLNIYNIKNNDIIKTNDIIKNNDIDVLKKDLIYYYSIIIKARKYVNIYRKIQLIYRLKHRIKKIVLQGMCYYDKTLSNNQEDFYNFENITEIPNIYHFSFMDINGFCYTFDIRTLKKLLDYGNGNGNGKAINPYSTNQIIPSVLFRINKYINQLEWMGISLELENKDKLTPEQNRRNAIFKVFSLIDELGYQTNIDWLLKMRIEELKNLYYLMEDIWNYRSDLSYQAKLEIIPTENTNPLFTLSVSYVLGLNNYNKVLEAVLNIFERLVSEGIDIGTKTLGALYVLTGVSTISTDASIVYPDLVQYEY